MRKLVCVLAVGLLPIVASAATPSEGVALQVRRGFFVETDLGALQTLGGNNAYSNLQSYLQLGVGYDVSRLIEVALLAGMGANADNCFAATDKNGNCTETSNFTMTFVSVSVSFLVQVIEHLYITPKVVVGYTFLDPAPVATGTGADRKELKGAMHGGVGVGFEYATSMDHFSLGLDVTARYIVGLGSGFNVVLEYYPRVKYTF